MNIPKDLHYTKDHEWVKRIDEQTVLVGITDFAQGELGDIVYIDVEVIDKEINAREVFGTIEAIKTVSDLMMPVKGVIVECNPELSSSPELINNHPYDEGWIIKVSLPEESDDLSQLLSYSEYSELVGSS